MSPRHDATQARQTRAQILTRASQRASVEGLDGLTLGPLAADLGLSKAGVVGPFGSREDLLLGVLDVAVDTFVTVVWNPVAELPAGRPRLLAACESWISYLSDCPFPGGCVLTTASVEWDARAGRVHDKVCRIQARWLSVLAADAEVAVRAGELPDELAPAQVSFELSGSAMALNQAIQLFADATAPERARVAVARLLAER